MPVYYISDLSDVDKNASQMSLENIAYIGLRDVDVAEKEVLKKHNVTWYTKEELVRRGRPCVTLSIIMGFCICWSKVCLVLELIEGLKLSDALFISPYLSTNIIALSVNGCFVEPL